MLQAGPHEEAAAAVLTLLDGVGGLAPHAPPVPTRPVSSPALLLQVPEAVAVKGLRPCRWEFTVQVLVVSGSPEGSDLLGLVDQACQALAAGGLSVTTSPQLYQPPSTPAALPAVLIRGE